MRNAMFSLSRFVTKPITVVVYWEGMKKVHHAKNHGDAIEWLGCYGKDAVVYVYNRFGRLQAIRGETMFGGLVGVNCYV